MKEEKFNLKKIKITTILTLIVIFICNAIADWAKISQRIKIGWNRGHYPEATFLEFTTAEIIIFSILVIPTAILPLFYFMNQKEILKFKWKLKTKIIYGILDKYETEYHLSIHGMIQNQYLKDIKCNINLIPYNPTEKNEFKKPEGSAIMKFKYILEHLKTLNLNVNS